MDPVQNPYTPNAGAEPQAIAGRDDQLTSFDLLLGRLSRGRTEQSMIITGLRGVGKTVLLGQFREKTLAARWIVVEIEVQKLDEGAFRRTLASNLRTVLFQLSPSSRWPDAIRRAAAVLKSFTLSVDPDGKFQAGLDVDAAQGFADHGELGLDLTDVVIAIGEAARDRSSGVVLLLDEIQFLRKEQLEALIRALHRTVQRKLPIALVGAGLPQIAELAGDAKSYAERLFKFPEIRSLDAQDGRMAFAEPARQESVIWQPSALSRAMEITGGYPYFIQELGYAVWPLATGQTITLNDVAAAQQVYEAKLDSSFFRVRLDRATDLQRAYLRAMAGLGPEPQKAADVAAVLDRTSPQLAPTRAELINMGLLYTPSHGFAAFTVPHFDQFMLRAVPEAPAPPARGRRRRPQ